MFVLCPHCQFLVALEPATGQPPELCPRCREHLQPLREADQPAPVAEAVVNGESVPAAIGDMAPVAEQESDPAGVAAEMPVAEAHDIRPERPDVEPTETAPARNVEAKPAITPPARTPPMPKAIRWPSASARHRLAIASIPLLAILLLLQSLLADRTRLAADARWRPLMIVLCDALSCTLPPWREPAAFTLLDRDVRPDASRPGVLHVSAGFRNDARWPQPWPALLLTLSDADGRVAGARAFRPQDYLAAPATQNSLASGQSAKVSFDVVEPTRDVVAFTFDFR